MLQNHNWFTLKQIYSLFFDEHYANCNVISRQNLGELGGLYNLGLHKGGHSQRTSEARVRCRNPDKFGHRNGGGGDLTTTGPTEFKKKQEQKTYMFLWNKKILTVK